MPSSAKCKKLCHSNDKKKNGKPLAYWYFQEKHSHECLDDWTALFYASYNTGELVIQAEGFSKHATFNMPKQLRV